MSATAKELALRWFEEVWNQQKSSAIDELFDREGKCYGFPDLNHPIGFEGFKEAHRAFCGAFPDIHIEIEDAVAEGDRVAVRWVATMTHLGDHLGFPASGRQTNFPGSSFMLAKDGKILFGWNYMDIPGLMESLKVAAQ
jgi:steroid delta-isomerase-like uncharacterized protein